MMCDSPSAFGMLIKMSIYATVRAAIVHINCFNIICKMSCTGAIATGTKHLNKHVSLSKPSIRLKIAMLLQNGQQANHQC